MERRARPRRSHCGNGLAAAEHQEDDADLRQLRRELGVGDETGREKTHDNAGQQGADEREQADARRQRGEGEDSGAADRERGDLMRAASAAKAKTQAQPIASVVILHDGCGRTRLELGS